MPTPRDLDLLWDIRTGALTFATATAVRDVGNYIKRSETLRLSLTIQEDGTNSTNIPANAKGTLKPVGNYAPSAVLATWENFTQVGSTSVFIADATINAAAVTTLLGLVQDFVNCVFDFAGDGVNESDTLGIILRNNVTRDDDTAPTVLVSRSDFLVTNGTGINVNIGLGILPSGASVAAQGPLALTDNATNYVQLNSSGVASANTSGFTDGYSPLAVVVTLLGAITSNADRRPWIDVKGGGSSGTVTSVGLTAPNIFTVSGSPVTTSGSLAFTLVAQVQKTFFAGPTSGADAAPAFRAIASADVPTLNQNTTGNAATASAVAVMDESSDTTCFVTFATGASGNQALKTSPSIAYNSLTGSLSLLGNVSVSGSFIGDGTFLNGTAAGLSIGGNAATVTNGVYTTDTGTVTNAMLAGSIDLTTKVTGVLPGANGGTGVANTGKTITLAGNLVITGAFNTTFAQAASTTITLPATSATMARTDAAQTFTGLQTVNDGIKFGGTGTISADFIFGDGVYVNGLFLSPSKIYKGSSMNISANGSLSLCVTTVCAIRSLADDADMPLTCSTATLSGALITTPESLAPTLNGGVAVGVTTAATSLAINGANALTLANGTNGQVKPLVCTAVTSAGTATLTPTTTNGFTTVAFTAAGQTLVLQYFTTGGWVILSVRGATPA